jgi:hypothetical protein
LHVFSELKVYFEIFNSDINVIKSHLHGDYDVVDKFFNSSAEGITRNVIVDNAAQYLQVLAKHNIDKRLVYKVLPGHLTQEQLKIGIASSEVIIIWHRNLLHSFISDCIATEMQRWASVDTSERKICFSEESFVHHVKRVVSFYDQVRMFANNITIIEVNYEKVISAVSPIVEVHKAFESINLKFDIDENKAKNFKLQDNRVMAEDKVSNPEELLRFLSVNNLEMLNDGENQLPEDIYSPLL